MYPCMCSRPLLPTNRLSPLLQIKPQSLVLATPPCVCYYLNRKCVRTCVCSYMRVCTCVK